MNPEESNFIQQLSLENPTETRLYADQILIEVTEQMLSLDRYELPVYNHEQLLGKVTFIEIMRFLTHQSKQNLLFHKLNYTLESLMKILENTSTNEVPESLSGDTNGPIPK